MADEPPHRFDVERRGDAVLALAVVAERRRSSESPAVPRLLHRRSVSSSSDLDRFERRHRKALERAGTPFSRARCWVTCRAWPLGRTGTISAAASAAAVATFSELEGDDVDAGGRRREWRRGRRSRRRSPRRRSGQWACRSRARTCGRGSPCAGRRGRTSGRADRCPARRVWRRAEHDPVHGSDVFPHRPRLRLAERV